MNADHQIVVTGLGVVSPIGTGVDTFWDALLQRRNAVRVREEFADCEWPLKVFAPVTDFDPKKYVRPRKALKVMCPPIQYGYAAAIMALEQAGIKDSGVDPDRIGTLFGSETFYTPPTLVTSVFNACIKNHQYIHDLWGETAMREIEPLWMLKYLPNMVASHVSIAADARGPSNSICTGEASSILALIEGADLIRRGRCDVVVVGGTGTYVPLTALLYRGENQLSRRVDEPEKASRPFDANRDGMVVGEGAGALILERASHARARGVSAIGSIDAWSRGFAAPASEGFSGQIEYHLSRVISEAGMDLGDLSHVNAHGLSTRRSDADEAVAIQRVAGDVPVLAIKSNFGYLGAGSGMIELIASIKALNEKQLPPTINYETADPQCPVNVNVELCASDKPAALKLSLSSGGQITCLALRR